MNKEYDCFVRKMAATAKENRICHEVTYKEECCK